MEQLIQAIRVSMRGLRRTPGFSLTAVGTLALGIGIAIAVFTVADALLLRRLPVRDQQRVVVLWGATRDGRFDNFPLTLREVRDFEQRARSLQRVEFFSYDDPFPKPLRDGDRIWRLRQTHVSGGFFDLLGARPSVGRLLRPEDDRVGAAPVVVLSHAAWQQKFGADTAVLGRRLTMHETGVAHTIIGVAAEGLDYPGRTEFWAPIIPATTIPNSDSSVAAVDLLGRLRPGRSLADARAELTAYFGRPDAPPWHRPVAGVAHRLENAILGDTKPALIAIAAAAGLLLLITCVNIANLLLVRGLARAREVAVRASLGASRARLVGELLVESILLAGAGGAIGLVLAIAAIRAFVAGAPPELPRLGEVGVGGSVLAVAMALTAVTVLLSGVAPAVVAARTGLNAILRSGGRHTAGGRRFRLLTEGLVVGQIATALLVLAAAGLVTRSLEKLQRVNLGFDASGLLIGELALRYDQFDDRARQMALIDGLMARVGSTPGVAAVSPVLAIPFSGSGGWDGRPPVEGESADEAATRPMLNMEVVAPNYFTTFRIPIVRGRGFTADDRLRSNPVVIVSESTARLYWPNADPVGRRFRLASGQLLTVVGIVPDTRYRDLRQPRPSLYVPLEHSWFTLPLTLAIRAAGDPARLVPSIRRAVADVDPGVSLVSAAPFEEFLRGPRAQPRLNAMLLATFALAAAALASVGLLAVMVTMVRHRTRELAIRQALGATPVDVARIVLGRAMAIAAAGAGLGLAGAVGTNRLVSAMLFQVTPSDGLTLAASGLLIVGVAAVAALAPIVATVRIQPIIALRAD